MHYLHLLNLLSIFLPMYFLTKAKGIVLLLPETSEQVDAIEGP